ncbi:MAG: O-antigen ligase family protein [Verrucomicrobia bacterium]|nr:O-antigen ligase family protein [Verrucomicrobiota bacterium]
MDRANLDQWCERGILVLALALLVFGPVAAGGVGGLEFSVILVLVIGIGALWLARIWLQDNYRLLWPPVCWCVVAFTGYAILRYQTAEIEYVARVELVRVLAYALLFFAVLNNLHRQETTQIIVFVAVFLGMTLSLYSVYQFITNSPYVWHLLRAEIKPEQYMKRATGTFICPNNFAGFLEILLPLGLSFTLKGRFRPTTRVLLGYASLAMLAGIGVSLSRGGWLSAGISLLIFFIVLLRYRDSRVPAIAFLALLAGLSIAFFKQAYHPSQRWQEMFRAEGGLSDVRFPIWQAATGVWKERPWFGAGPGHFDQRFPQFRPETVQVRPDRVHNDYLNTLADWGVVGAGLVALAWCFLFAGIFRTWRFVQRAGEFVAKPSSRAAFVLGGAMGLVAILIHSAMDFNMHIPANALLTVSLMALLTGYLRFATEKHWVTTSWISRTALTAVLLLGLSYLGQQGAKRSAEQLALDRADNARRLVQRKSATYAGLWRKAEAKPGEVDVDWTVLDRLSSEIRQGMKEEIDSLKQAHAADPSNFETAYRIGEILRNQSWQGESGYKELAQDAMEWFAKGMFLNPYGAYPSMRYGMCLHQLGRGADAEHYFKRAVELDPRSYYVVAHMGWHYYKLGNFKEASRWFTESRRLSSYVWRDNPQDNPIAWKHLDLIGKLMKESDR